MQVTGLVPAKTLCDWLAPATRADSGARSLRSRSWRGWTFKGLGGSLVQTPPASEGLLVPQACRSTTPSLPVCSQGIMCACECVCDVGSGLP